MLIVRMVLGLPRVRHGAQELLGWFGGYGPAGTGGYLASLGYRSGLLFALLAELGESGGGAPLALVSRRRAPAATQQEVAMA